MSRTGPWTLLPPRPRPGVELDERQRQAAEPRPGVTVVTGAAGTGKTVTLVESIALRVARGTSLERLVVLAGSRAAAQQLRRVISGRLGQAQVSFRVTTVHGFALGLLRQFSPPEDDWRLLRAPEQELRIRDLLSELGADFWPSELALAVPTRSFARQVRELLARARHESMDPSDVERLGRERNDPLLTNVAKVFERYLDVCDFDQSLDYAELVHRARLALGDPRTRSSVGAAVDAVIVDDVQDFDVAQVGLLADCAATGAAVHVFGDPLQRIGDFRGASAAVLPTLLALPGARRTTLEQSHRHSTRVAAALALQRTRLQALDAPPAGIPAAAREGTVTASVYDDDASQAAHVAEQIRHLTLEGGLEHSQIAVIAKSGRAQLAPMARELTRYGIPVEVAGDELALAQQLPVRHLLLAMSVATRGREPDADAARRLLASPLAGIDGVAQRTLARQLRLRHAPQSTSGQMLAGALWQPDLTSGLTGPDVGALRELAAALAATAEAATAGASVEEMLWLLWDGTSWPARLRDRALAGAAGADHDLDAVVELFDVAARRPELVGASGAATFVMDVQGEEIPADTGRESSLSGRGVRLVTAHRARTGAWKAVFVVGAQEGQWPRFASRSLILDPDALTVGHVERSHAVEDLAAERRLFHAACGRAEDELHVSAVQGTEGELGRPSRFLRELGVDQERVHGVPARPLTPSMLVADLRRALEAPSASEPLQRAAAARLARMTTTPGVAAADPGSWWGVREPSSPVATAGEIVVTGSSLQQLLACPRHWFLARRAKAEVGRNSRASVGDVVHLLAQRLASGELDGPGAREELARVWDRIPFEAEWLSLSERVAIDQALDRYLEWDRTNGNQLLGVEVPFRIELQVDGTRVIASGTVDRLELDEGRLRIVDIKTGRSRVTKKDIGSHSQLGLYQLAATLGAFDLLAPGIRATAPAALVYLRHGDSQPEVIEQPALQPTETPPASQGTTWVHDQLRVAVDTITSGRYPATLCTMCSYCPFADSCPAVHQGLSGGTP